MNPQCGRLCGGKAAAHACCGGASSPLPRSDTDIARHRFRRSLFSCRTTDPSHTDATMWPKHAAETSADDTNLSCCPRDFHVHAWSESRMCLHHAHFVPCASVEHSLRRVPRARIATRHRRKETGSSREKLSGEKFSAQRNREISIWVAKLSTKAVGLHTVRSAPASQACELDTQNRSRFNRLPQST